MAFGLTDAPAWFQGAVAIIPSKYEWQTSLVYLDVVVIFSKTLDVYVIHVHEVLTTVADVTLKINKGRFFQTRVECSDHMVTPGSLEPDKGNLKSL